MIVMALTVLLKAEPVQRNETNKLEQLTARSIRVQKLEAEKGTELEAARARLVEVIGVGKEELRPQAIVKAERTKETNYLLSRLNFDHMLGDKLDASPLYLLFLY